MSLSIAAYRQAGDQIEDDDVHPNANIQISKLGTRTLYLSIPATLFQRSGSGVALVTSGVFGGVTLPNANTGNLYASVPLPDEYDSGTITLRVFWKTAATAGNLKLNANLASVAKDGALTVEEAETATVAANGTTNLLNEATFTFTASDFEAGDIVGVNLNRDPADVADTLASDVMIIEATLEFTGRG